MDVITTFLEGAAGIVQDFGNILVEAVGTIANILYTPGVEGAPGSLTIVGGALALALGVGVVYLMFRMVRGLIKSNNRG